MFDSENYGFVMPQALIPAETVLPVLRWKFPCRRDATPPCPRCASPNTKFCYYNNYSLSQPRYFCKACRRYWTKGGSLRKVPVGGGCRKKRRARINPLGKQGGCAAEAQTLEQRPGTGGGKDPKDAENVAEIDLAVVFAKFLNDNSSSKPINTAVTPDGTSGCTGQESRSLVDLYPQINKENKQGGMEGKIENKTSLYGLEYLLDDEAIRDIMSSDDDQPAATMANSLTWEWPGQRLEDLLDLIPTSDSEPKLSPDLVKDDDWSSLDLPGFDTFRNPWF